MRRIRKSAEPSTFTAWCKGIKRPRPIPLWSTFPDPPRADVRRLLLNDQVHLCCYCCSSISNGSFHIEHFRPRKLFPHLTYNWPNFLASCEGWQQNEQSEYTVETQRHCGASKDNWFQDGVTVDPQAADADSLFIYRLDGQVFARKTLAEQLKNSVELTIRRLNLDAPSLRARRAAILAQASLDAAKMTKADWVKHYLSLRPNGASQEFAPALQYNFDKHWSHSMV